MPDSPLQFVEIAAAALAGPATAMASAATSGRIVAGDDRGEVGLWDAAGARLFTFRVGAAVCDVDLSLDGSRAAVRSVDGGLVVVDANGRKAFAAKLAGPGMVRVDPCGDSVFCVEPALGRATVFNAWGKKIGEFAIPSPVAGCAVHPRDKGLIASTSRGVVARFTPWGEQVWSVDRAQYAGGLALDARGSLLVVVGHGRGAEALAPDDGAPMGSFDVARSIEAAAVSRRHVLVATSDRRVILLDRAGHAAVEAQMSVKPRGVSLRDDSRHAGVRLDDGTVRFWSLTSASSARVRRPSTVGGAPEGGAPPCEAFRMKLFGDGTLVRAAIVSVSPGGRTLAVACGSRSAMLLRRDGTPLEDTRHEGRALAVRAADDGSATLVTTREIRKISAGRSRGLRSFAVEPWKAVFAPDGETAAVLDELGTLRIVGTADGEDRFCCEIGTLDSPRTIYAAGGHVAWQRRTGEIGIADVGGTRRLPTGAGPEPARLVAAGADGPFVAEGDAVAAYSWDGAERWRARLPAPVVEAGVARDGALVCVAAGDARVFGADGASLARFVPPTGRLVAVETDGVEPSATPVLTFVDGRRVVVVGEGGRPRWHATLAHEIGSVATARAGRSVAAISGEGLLLMETDVPDDAARVVAAASGAC